MNFDELVKELDKDISIINIKKKDNTIFIKCELNTTKSKCPFCGEESTSIHSKYIRKLSDLPIQNNEVKLELITRKFFCDNYKCEHKTFGERFDFVEPKAVRTKRLDNYINNIGLRDTSMDAVRTLKDSGIKVSSNTVLRLVKKNQK